MLHGLFRARHLATRLTQPHVAVIQCRHLLTLAIETSCDDTCVAILSTRGPEPQQTSSTPPKPQAELHFHEKVTARNTGHGGIHPLEALASHQVNLAALVDKSLKYLPEPKPGSSRSQLVWNRDGACRQKPDFVSVTRGPGMRSNLCVGLDTAKGLATAWQVPLVGVHHMQAHALTPRLVHALHNTSSDLTMKPAFPFLTLLVSGGHTMLVHSRSLTSHHILANTLDTAIGDCLDKCGRALLPASILSGTPDTAYGKYLSTYAFPDPSTFSTYPIPLRRSDEVRRPPHPYGWSIQTPLASTRDLAFSFAGLASTIARLASPSQPLSDRERLLLARTALGTAFEHLGSRVVIALSSLPSHSQSQLSTLVVSGGVAANPFLRHFLRGLLDARGFRGLELVFPPVELCTDNAAMIAWAGTEMFARGYRTNLGCDVRRKWGMDEKGEDGGILGSGGGRGREQEEILGRGKKGKEAPKN